MEFWCPLLLVDGCWLEKNTHFSGCLALGFGFPATLPIWEIFLLPSCLSYVLSKSLARFLATFLCCFLVFYLTTFSLYLSFHFSTSLSVSNFVLPASGYPSIHISQFLAPASSYISLAQFLLHIPTYSSVGYFLLQRNAVNVLLPVPRKFNEIINHSELLWWLPLCTESSAKYEINCLLWVLKVRFLLSSSPSVCCMIFSKSFSPLLSYTF